MITLLIYHSFSEPRHLIEDGVFLWSLQKKDLNLTLSIDTGLYVALLHFLIQNEEFFFLRT